jgi:hypothetical protein
MAAFLENKQLRILYQAFTHISLKERGDKARFSCSWKIKNPQDTVHKTCWKLLAVIE